MGRPPLFRNVLHTHTHTGNHSLTYTFIYTLTNTHGHFSYATSCVRYEMRERRIKNYTRTVSSFAIVPHERVFAIFLVFSVN
jgi:hypothetical protein